MFYVQTSCKSHAPLWCDVRKPCAQGWGWMAVGLPFHHLKALCWGLNDIDTRHKVGEINIDFAVFGGREGLYQLPVDRENHQSRTRF